MFRGCDSVLLLTALASFGERDSRFFQPLTVMADLSAWREMSESVKTSASGTLFN